VFHVINRSAKRGALFEGTSDYVAFEQILGEAITRGRVSLFAYCLMPNHWHLVISPQVDTALSRFMHWLTMTHATRWQVAKGQKGSGAVYQGRFKAIPIGDDRHFLWVCRYVERNALRASLVNRAEDWRWSSLGQRARGDVNWLTPWPISPPADWTTHVNAPQTDAELIAFRRAIAMNRPFGEEDWQLSVMTRLGMAPARPRGRPARQDARCPRKMTPDPFTRS
jgi:putative transposase